MHKLKYHRNEEAVMLTSDRWECPPIDNLDEQTKNILGIIKTGRYPQKFNRWNCKTEKEQLGKISFQDNLKYFENEKIDLKNFTDRYVCEDFGRGVEVFFLQNGYEYGIVEATGDCTNLIGEKAASQKNTFYDLYNDLLKENGQCTQMVYSFVRDNETHPTATGWCFLNYRELYRELGDDERNAIFDIFRMDDCFSCFEGKDEVNIYCPDNVERMRNIYKMTWDEAFSVTELLLDYGYSKNKIIVKPHPKSPTYQYYFGNNMVMTIPNFIPMEMIEVVDKIKINDFFAGFGASSNNMKGRANRIISFNADYISFAKYFPKICFAAQIIDAVKEDKDGEVNVFTRNIKESQEELIQAMEIIQGKKLSLSEELCLENADKTRYVFVGSKNSYNYAEEYKCLNKLSSDAVAFCVMDYDLWVSQMMSMDKNMEERFFPMVIRKRPIRKNISIGLEDEVLFVYTKSKDIREKIMKLHLEKTNEYSGVELTMEYPVASQMMIIMNSLNQINLKRKIDGQAKQIETMKEELSKSKTAREIELYEEMIDNLKRKVEELTQGLGS